MIRQQNNRKTSTGWLIVGWKEFPLHWTFETSRRVCIREFLKELNGIDALPEQYKCVKAVLRVEDWKN